MPLRPFKSLTSAMSSLVASLLYFTSIPASHKESQNKKKGEYGKLTRLY